MASYDRDEEDTLSPSMPSVYGPFPLAKLFGYLELLRAIGGPFYERKTLREEERKPSVKALD